MLRFFIFLEFDDEEEVVEEDLRFIGKFCFFVLLKVICNSKLFFIVIYYLFVNLLLFIVKF